MFQRSVPTSSNPVLSHSFMFIGRVVPVIIWDAPLPPQRCATWLPPRFGRSGFSRLQSLHLAAAFKHKTVVFFFCISHSYLVVRHSMYIGSNGRVVVTVVPVIIQDPPLPPQRCAVLLPPQFGRSRFTWFKLSLLATAFKHKTFFFLYFTIVPGHLDPGPKTQ